MSVSARFAGSSLGRLTKPLKLADGLLHLCKHVAERRAHIMTVVDERLEDGVEERPPRVAGAVDLKRV